jgi:hypothetical protein
MAGAPCLALETWDRSKLDVESVTRDFAALIDLLLCVDGFLSGLKLRATGEFPDSKQECKFSKK